MALEFGGVREVFPTHRAAVKERWLFILALIGGLGGSLCRINAWDGAVSCVNKKRRKRCCLVQLIVVETSPKQLILERNEHGHCWCSEMVVVSNGTF